MAESQRRSLSIRVNEIIENFRLISETTEITITNNQKQDFIRAMILLCHAEFECHIENLAKSIVDHCKADWNSNRSASYSAAALFINASLTTNDTWDTKANKIFSDHNKVITTNHGIKEENIRKLFAPLGFPVEHFDSLFIGQVNSFGGTRGLIAHTSSNIQTELDFESERIKICEILISLEEFEHMLDVMPGSEARNNVAN